MTMTLSNSVYASLKKRGRYNSFLSDLESLYDIDANEPGWQDSNADHCLTDFEE